MGRCIGITKKNEQCRIVVNSSEPYCQYHKYQQNQPKDSRSLHLKNPSRNTPNSIRPGYIYIFTLDHLLLPDPPKEKWLLELNQKEKIARPSVFNPKHNILIKVGYTTQLVSSRLDQWNRQCKQDFKLITPQLVHKIVVSKKDKLVQLLSNLSLTNDGDLKHFDYKNLGFWCQFDSFKSEKLIHSKLRRYYGNGHLICDNCKLSSTGIHKEWFLVPRIEVSKVLRLIDETVS